MTYNFSGSSFNLDQAGLELSLNDFAFDPAQANQVQQHLQQQQQQQIHQQHHQKQHLQQQHQEKQLQQQEQRQLQNLLLRDDPSQRLATESQPQQQQQQMMDETPSTSSSGPYDFTPSMTAEMMASISASVTTTPVFQPHPDKANSNSNGNHGATFQQQLQQQHRQQQLFLQQQQQRQQQQLLQQQRQQLQQFPQGQNQVSKDGGGGGAGRQQLLTPVGSEYYATDYSQYMSPLGIQPTTTENTVVVSDQFDDEEVQFTPLISPAITPSHPYSNLPPPMSTANEHFSPLTSPALQPHRTSQIDYLSFSGPGFSSLPIQFQQAHQVQQQQIQNQIKQLQAQTQGESSQQLQLQQQQQQKLTNELQQQLQKQKQQQQQQQQMQGNQGGISAKHARVDTQSPALNSQRPPMKRRNTTEQSLANNGQQQHQQQTSSAHLPRPTGSNGGGPVRTTLSKASSASRPLSSHPISPALRKQNVTTSSRSRPSSTLAPASPLVIQFPAMNGSHQPTPSPILTSTTTQQSQSQSQPSPSPHLVTNMNHLSMMPPSPAPFVLPASSMIPLQGSPMILPLQQQQQSQGQMQTPRQLSISQPVQVQQTRHPSVAGKVSNQQQQQHHRLSIHQPIQISPAPSTAVQSSKAGTSSSMNGSGTTVESGNGEENITMTTSSSSITTATSSTTGTPKSALAPVTPASLMNLSGSESTPTASPKFGAGSKARTLLSKSNQNGDANNKASSGKAIVSKSTSSTSTSTSSHSGGAKRGGIGGSKRQTSGSTTAGTLAPRTPGTTATAIIAPMPPPPSGFATLISPALKPTLMPQPTTIHRGSISGQTVLVSPRAQPLLVSPSLKPWLPGVSTSEAMARLASKSNYQNILDGDHTALGLSYNTDLHSGIELRRTSHKAAEQKRRDSLKHCFEDLRQMIPNIVDKAPSKVFLLKKSFDYICALKSDLAQRDLIIARMQAQQDFLQQSLKVWFEQQSFPEKCPKPDFDLWKLTDDTLDKITAKELETAQIAAEIADQSAAAVDAARVGHQQGTGGEGGNKDGKNSRGDNGPPSSTSSSSSSSTASKSLNSASAAISTEMSRENNGKGEDDFDEESDEESELACKQDNTSQGSITRNSDMDNDSGVHPKITTNELEEMNIDGTEDAQMRSEQDISNMVVLNPKGRSQRRPRSRSVKSGQGGEGNGDNEEDEQDEDDDEEEDDEEEEEDEDYDEDHVQGAIQDQEMADVSDQPSE
ncbi:hypothetical protein BGX28_002066 [Mortierella sp. GBA30]|nr:hypothetical protein BGX28_002066 [Mortierella sp. GBA30]